MFDEWGWDVSGRLKNYNRPTEQLRANVGWVYAANTAIVEPCAAVELKLYRKKADGDREEVTDGPALEILQLLDEPNFAHTGEQLRQLHHTYMNFVGDSYILMLKGGEPFIPTKGQLPDALQILPSHQVSFKLGDTYTKSVVKFGQVEYPILSVIRDINPDPDNPYNPQSIIKAAAAVIDTEEQMKNWNRKFFANNARPSLIFNTDQELSEEAYRRWKEQFQDEHGGVDNAFKPLLVEGGKATPYMLSQSDLDFLDSRKFSRDEILAMFRVNPYTIGSVENVNLATAKAARMQHAEINVEPRVRQFVRQLNASLVRVFDPTLELGFVSPVPEDDEAKLAAAEAGVNKWMTIDEVRAEYGMEPLPEDLGNQLYIPGTLRTIQSVADGTAAPVAAGGNANADPQEGDPQAGDIQTGKSLAGVKKKT